MSETPRTDERELAAIDLKPSARVVYASFARQLETELTDKDKLIEQLKLALKTLRKYPHTYKMTGQGSIIVDKDLEQCDAALLAAERDRK